MTKEPIARLPKEYVQKLLDAEVFLAYVLAISNTSELKCWNLEGGKLRHAATVYLTWDGEYITMKLCVIKWAQKYVDNVTLDAIGFERLNPVGTVWNREYLTNAADAGNYLATALNALIGLSDTTAFSVDVQGVRLDFLYPYLAETGWALKNEKYWAKKAA